MSKKGKHPFPSTIFVYQDGDDEDDKFFVVEETEADAVTGGSDARLVARYVLQNVRNIRQVQEVEEV